MPLPKIPTLDDIKKAFGNDNITRSDTTFFVSRNGAVTEQVTYDNGENQKLRFSRHHTIAAPKDDAGGKN